MLANHGNIANYPKYKFRLFTKYVCNVILEHFLWYDLDDICFLGSIINIRYYNMSTMEESHQNFDLQKNHPFGIGK